MPWADGAWKKYLATKGKLNINPHGNVLELDLIRADGSSVTFALNPEMARLIGSAGQALQPSKDGKGGTT